MAEQITRGTDDAGRLDEQPAESPGTTKVERERDFHDKAYRESTRRRIWGFYDTTSASHERSAPISAASRWCRRREASRDCGVSCPNRC